MSISSAMNECGNFQEIRNMWSLRAQSKPLYPILEGEQSSKNHTQMVPMVIKTYSISTIEKESSLPSRNTKKMKVSETLKKISSIEEYPSEKNSLPSQKSFFKHQAQSISTIKQTLNKMNIPRQNLNSSEISFNNGAHRWHIAKSVFRSGLVLNRARRASDSILPILIKTHQSTHRSRADSVDSILSQTAFEASINYITYNEVDKNNPTPITIQIKRSSSDFSNCIQRNKLDDSIAEYESILRHLKNYEQFMSTYSSQTNTTKQGDEIIGTNLNTILHEAEAKFRAPTVIPHRQTQSLSRNAGRTFSEFIMNDLFSSIFTSNSSAKGQQCVILQASSKTESLESTEEINNEVKELTESIMPSAPVQTDENISPINEETNSVLNEFDAILDNHTQEPAITPNSEVNVIIVQPTIETEKIQIQKPLMQRLFEGNKTGYSSTDLNMKTIRLPEEMMIEYETAKTRCFFDSEQPIYVAKMIKISRRGYTQHVRMLCITTERVYNLTKRKSYPKEGLLFNDILGITCTPYKDGFICIHTREVYNDRGDWLIVVDHPYEFITQLFLIMKKDNNDDQFLKFETKFTHCRRSYGEGMSNDCSIEIRSSDSFLVKKASFDSLIIVS